MSTTTIARTDLQVPRLRAARRPGRRDRPATGVLRRARPHPRVARGGNGAAWPPSRSAPTISPAEDGSPLTTARMTGAELLRSLRAEADRITALGAGLRDRIDTLTDPTAAEAEVEAVRAAAEQRAATSRSPRRSCRAARGDR